MKAGVGSVSSIAVGVVAVPATPFINQLAGASFSKPVDIIAPTSGLAMTAAVETISMGDCLVPPMHTSAAQKLAANELAFHV